MEIDEFIAEKRKNAMNVEYRTMWTIMNEEYFGPNFPNYHLTVNRHVDSVLDINNVVTTHISLGSNEQ